MSPNLSAIYFVAHLCALVLGSSRDNGMGYEYYPQLFGYLKLHTKPANWLTARVNCHNEDALLVSPWTGDFTSAVHELQSNEESLSLLYSGAILEFPEGTYKNMIERLPVVSSNFELCGVFFANGTTGEVDCKRMLPYVCYATTAFGSTTTLKSVPTPKPEPRCFDHDYTFYKENGHCYNFYFNASTTADDMRKCTLEGGSIITAKNATVNMLIQELDKHDVQVPILADISDWIPDNGEALSEYTYIFGCEKAPVYLTPPMRY